MAMNTKSIPEKEIKQESSETSVAVPVASDPIPLSQNTEMLIREINEIKTDTYRFLNSALSQAKRNSFEIGKRLVQLKESCKHGEWLVALSQVEYSDDVAQRMMRIYREFDPEIKAFQDLNYSQMVALFPVPVAERPKFAEENEVANLTVAEIKRLIRDKEEAEKRATEASKRVEELSAKRENDKAQKALETTKKQLERDLSKQKELLLKESLEVAKLREEVKSLKASPLKVVERVYEPSQEQLDEVREATKNELEAEMQEKLQADLEKRLREIEKEFKKNEEMQDPRALEVNVLLQQLQVILQCISSNLKAVGNSDLDQKFIRALDHLLKEFFGRVTTEA